MNFDPVTDKCEEAFCEYINAQNAAALAAYGIVLAKQHATLPIPGVVFAVSEDAVKERVHGHGIFDVPLDIYVGTESEQDKLAVAHKAAAGAIIAHLNDKASVRSTLNTVANPDVRPVQDFLIYDYSLRGQPTRILAGATWETVIKLLVVCQGRNA